MGQHAKRFDAVNAQKGSGLAAVVAQLKTTADIAEEWFDPNSSEVTGAMQRFEQGLALLTTAPARPEQPAKESKPRARRAKPKDDTPGADGGESTEEAS